MASSSSFSYNNNHAPPPPSRAQPPRSRIDELLASRKQTSSRQRFLDNLSQRIGTERAAEIMESNQDDVMEKVAELLVDQQSNSNNKCRSNSTKKSPITTATTSRSNSIPLQKLFLLQGLSLSGAKALSRALSHPDTSLGTLKILHNNSNSSNDEGGEGGALQYILNHGIPVSRITELVLHDCSMTCPLTSCALDSAIHKSQWLQRLSIVDIPIPNVFSSNENLNLLETMVTTTTGRPGLKELKLIRCGIDERGASAIATALKKASHQQTNGTTTNTCTASCCVLEYLSLEGNPVGNDGAKALADALRDDNHNNTTSTATLQHLILCRSCSISNPGAMAFGAMLPFNSSLQELDLSGNPNISIAGKEALVEGLLRNVSLLSTGMRVAHRHPLRPTVVEQMGDLLSINLIRYQWNNHKKNSSSSRSSSTIIGVAVPISRGRRRTSTATGTGGLDTSASSSTRRGNHSSNQLHPTAPSSSSLPSPTSSSYLSSSLLPFYFAKVSGKAPVLYLSVQENVDLFLPYIGQRSSS